VAKHVGALRTAIHSFLILQASAIATTAAELYARATKADEDKVKAILSKLGLDDWDDLPELTRAALVAVFAEGGEAALKALDLKEPALFDRLNQEALDYAKARGAELVGMRYNAAGELVTNNRAEWAINESTRDGLKDLLSLAFDEGMTPAELAEAIRDDYLFSQARADMIARTELSFAHVQGEIDAMKASGVVSGKSLLLSDQHDEDDECDDAEAQGVVDLDDGDVDPPLHPNCECTLVYEVEEQEEAA
jgi:hypothetical protein